MTEHLFDTPINARESAEITDFDGEHPLVNSASYSDTLPQETVLVQDKPVSVVAGKSVEPRNPALVPDVPASVSPLGSEGLFSHAQAEPFRTRWNEIQGKFVDEPAAAVKEADELVSEVIQQMTQMFAKERGVLEGQWNQGNDVSTEDLRMILQRYRTFFHRLLV